jgi:1-acyl-sn-glycerol-3-phosphate acyltransferase
MILLRSLLFQAALYAWTGILGLLYLPLLLGPSAWAMRCGSFWSAGVLKLAAWCVRLDYEVRGRANLPAGPAIIAMKHQSAWDTFAVPVVFSRPAMVIKRELGFVPLYGWYALKAGMIPVDRGAGAKALRRLVAAAERAVAAGRPVFIFPEGTRTAVGARPVYQSGVAALYRQLGLPLVPVAVNSGLFWGRREFAKRPGRIVVEILPAIPPGLDRREALRRLESAIEEATARLIAENGMAPSVENSVQGNRG